MRRSREDTKESNAEPGDESPHPQRPHPHRPSSRGSLVQKILRSRDYTPTEGAGLTLTRGREVSREHKSLLERSREMTRHLTLQRSREASKESNAEPADSSNDGSLWSNRHPPSRSSALSRSRESSKESNGEHSPSKEDDLANLIAHGMLRWKNTELSRGWSKWVQEWKEQRTHERTMRLVVSRLRKPKMVACFVGWKYDWEMAEREARLLAEERARQTKLEADNAALQGCWEPTTLRFLARRMQRN